MKLKNEQLLRNPNLHPTSDVVAKALGEANKAYMNFLDELANHDIQLVWRYYTDGKAWLAKGLYQWTGVRGGQKETTVFWLSIWDGFFKVTIYIPEKARVEMNNNPFDHEIKQMIANSKQMGKLKTFPLVFDVCSNEMFGAIFSLVDFKKKLQGG